MSNKTDPKTTLLQRAYELILSWPDPEELTLWIILKRGSSEVYFYE